MILLSRNGKCLYDTSSGVAITVDPTSAGMFVLRASTGHELGLFDTESVALEKMQEISVNHGVVRL